MASKRSTKKVFVLDTNVLLHDPNSLFRFQEHDVYIAFVAMEELDKHKVGTNDINRNARQATRLLEEVTAQKGSFKSGFPLNEFNGRHATGKLYMQSEAIHPNDELGDSKKNDNMFLAVLAHLQEQSPSRKAVLVTKDLNLRVKARALGYESEDYLNDHAVEDSDLLYRGYRYLDDASFADISEGVESWKEQHSVFYRVRQIEKEPFFPQEMVVFPDGLLTVVQKVTGDEVILRTIREYGSEKNNVFGVTARNEEQSFALNLLMDPEVHFVTLLGPAGTGKTLLTLAAALEQVVEDKRFSEIIFTRATVPMGEDIGFLPGSEEEKMMPWMGALDDNLDFLLGSSKAETQWHAKTTKDLVRERIKIKSMSFMRGRTFAQKFLIIDEAQNLTPKQMKALITRAGMGTKVVCMGNLAQVDTPYLSERSSGLAYAVERFKGWKRYGHVILEKGERSELANYANDNL
jgi:PhoH-like ATPase